MAVRYTEATVTSSAPYITGETAYSVSVALKSGVSASILSVSLTIGSQTVIRTGLGTLTLTPNTAGPYDVSITVKGRTSGGIVREFTERYIVESINVIDFGVYIQKIDAIRTNTNGYEFENGTNACLAVTIDYTVKEGHYLSKPTTKIDGVEVTNWTWYSSWDPATGFSNAITNTAWNTYAPTPPVTIYCRATSTVSDTQSYIYAVTAKSNMAESTEMTVKLLPSFRLLSAKAGGLGLGIGMRPTSDALWLNINTEMIAQKDIHFNLDPVPGSTNIDYDLYDRLYNANVDPNLKAILTYLMTAVRSDYVVEQGTSGIWTYRKWNSGISECWGTSTRSNVAMGQWGSTVLYYGTITADSWPSNLFTSAPNANMFARVSGGNGWLTQTTNMTASTTGTRYVIGVSNTTLSAVNIVTHAIGRWK